MISKKYTTALECSLIILYLLVGFTPYFNAIDKIGPQFLYLSILNSVGSIYILFTFRGISFKNASYPLLSLLLLIFWSFCSLFYAINKSEVLIETSRIIIYLFSFIYFFIFVDRNKHLLKYAPYLISFILMIELFYVYDRFFTIYEGKAFSRTLLLRGYTGNINITAFSFLLKFPFLLTVISRTKIHASIKILVLTIFLFALFLLGSRGAILTLFISVLFSISSAYVLNQSSFFSKKHILILLISVFLAGSFNSFLFKDQSSINVIDRSINLNNDSTQERLRFYKAAVNSIIQNPILGIGIGNWKIHSIEYDKPFMTGYRVPYHVHNDYLEIFTELGIIGLILFFGIFLWTFFLIFSSIKSKEYLETNLFYLVSACALSLIIYLTDSFLNFPFTRPVIQIQNLFYIVLILVILNKIKVLKKGLNIRQTGILKKISFFTLILSGLIFSSFISHKVFKSFVEQQFLLAAANGSFTDYTKEYVESISSDIPSITATTIPIETLKANLIFNKKADIYEDTLHYMIAEGKKQNPFLPYNEHAKSVLLIRQLKPDSAYVYAKKAFYELPNHISHFDLLMDIAEAYKDSIEVEKAMSSLNEIELRDFFYDKYLEVTLNIKNDLGLTESKILEKYNSKNIKNDKLTGYNAIFEVGIKNVEDGYMESIDGNKYFDNKDFEKAAKSFEKAFKFNPTEASYYENSANAYMKIGKDENAIKILEELINKLNPSTGKAEYLLGLIYIGQRKNNLGCTYLTKSKQNGFNIPDIVFEKFCSLESKNYTPTNN